jgi:hypothetical protein
VVHEQRHLATGIQSIQLSVSTAHGPKLAAGATVMRMYLTIVLSILMVSCSAKSSVPVAAVEIHAQAIDQHKVLEAIQNFGRSNGFEVLQGTLQKQHRLVLQVDLKRDGKILVTADNFMRPEVLEIVFYADSPGAEWQTTKNSLMREIGEVIDGRGRIVEVPKK